LHLGIGEVVLQGGLVPLEIAEMGEQFVLNPALGVEAEPRQQVGGMAGMFANIGQGLILLTELQGAVGLLGLAQQHGTHRLLQMDILLTSKAHEQLLGATH
jgi:hypothetical protein